MFIYAASVESVGLEKTIEILGEVTLRPKLTEDEVCIFFNKYNIP